LKVVGLAALTADDLALWSTAYKRPAIVLCIEDVFAGDIGNRTVRANALTV
jgi:hypothetical protein